MSKLLSIPATANATGLAVTLVRRLVKNGEIPSLIVGARPKISEQWVQRWIATANPEIPPCKIA
jgi:excisionase family DNA binding protein